MEEMADVVEEVFQYYGLKNTICFGVGAGANVFTRLGLKDPKHVECLILINGVATTSSWSEWGYDKVRFFLNFVCLFVCLFVQQIPIYWYNDAGGLHWMFVVFVQYII